MKASRLQFDREIRDAILREVIHAFEYEVRSQPDGIVNPYLVNTSRHMNAILSTIDTIVDRRVQLVEDLTKHVHRMPTPDELRKELGLDHD